MKLNPYFKVVLAATIWAHLCFCKVSCDSGFHNVIEKKYDSQKTLNISCFILRI